jgi:hypothetical protein
MTIHVISAGPSAKHADTRGSRLVLAVNRAALVVPHDAVVAGDVRTLRDLRPTQLWTMKNQDPIPDGWRHVRRFDMLPGWTDLGKPANWSIQGAIAVCVHLKETDIIIWGLDAYMRDPKSPEDCSGYAGADADRTQERWRREREDIDRSIAWAQRQGATITIRM